ncbi:hypothetical protein V6Z12_D08G262200 [Gossypium hirsutum]|uniref:Uncharacterized protein n=1 Tax=Gossypium darwinii TaxID=34276 RepID=A0A5D2BPC3_GOSDA|nr:hypothetical protein ES288_D08G272000v1 [Gossypium darwinii]
MLTHLPDSPNSACYYPNLGHRTFMKYSHETQASESQHHQYI